MVKGAQQESRVAGERAVVPVRAAGGEPGKAQIVAAISDSDPADLWVAVSPNNDTEYDPPPVAIFVGVGGHVVLRGADGFDATFKNIPNGSILPLQPSRLLVGTTATDIIFIYRSDPA
jgi:hypothetical protein